MGQRRTWLSLSSALAHPVAPRRYPPGNRGVAAPGQWGGGPPGEGSWWAVRLWRRCTACTSSDHACAPTKCGLRPRALRAGGTLSVPTAAQRSGPSLRMVVMARAFQTFIHSHRLEGTEGLSCPIHFPRVCAPLKLGILSLTSVSPLNPRRAQALHDNASADEGAWASNFKGKILYFRAGTAAS